MPSQFTLRLISYQFVPSQMSVIVELGVPLKLPFSFSVPLSTRTVRALQIRITHHLARRGVIAVIVALGLPRIRRQLAYAA